MHGNTLYSNIRLTDFACCRSSLQRDQSGMCDEVTMENNPAYGAVEFDGKMITL